MTILSPTDALQRIITLCSTPRQFTGSQPTELRLDVLEVARVGLATTAQEGPDHEFAARQHLQTVKALDTLLAAGYDKLELAARVVCRVAKEGDATELADVIANLGRVVHEQHLLRARPNNRETPGVPCGQTGCLSCRGTGRVVVDTGDIRTTQRCACTLVK